MEPTPSGRPARRVGRRRHDQSRDRSPDTPNRQVHNRLQPHRHRQREIPPEQSARFVTKMFVTKMFVAKMFVAKMFVAKMKDVLAVSQRPYDRRPYDRRPYDPARPVVFVCVHRLCAWTRCRASCGSTSASRSDGVSEAVSGEEEFEEGRSLPCARSHTNAPRRTPRDGHRHADGRTLRPASAVCEGVPALPAPPQLL